MKSLGLRDWESREDELRLWGSALGKMGHGLGSGLRAEGCGGRNSLLASSASCNRAQVGHEPQA